MLFAFGLRRGRVLLPTTIMMFPGLGPRCRGLRTRSDSFGARVLLPTNIMMFLGLGARFRGLRITTTQRPRVVGDNYNDHFGPRPSFPCSAPVSFTYVLAPVTLRHLVYPLPL